MRDLDERHASRLDEVLNHQWLIRRAEVLRVEHDPRARRIVKAEPRLMTLDVHVAARAIADRLRRDPAPSPSPEPAGDRESSLAHVRRLKSMIQEGRAGE